MPNWTRRNLLQVLSLTGIGTATFQRAIADQAAQQAGLSIEQIARAEWIAGVTLTDEQRQQIHGRVNEIQKDAAEIRSIPIDYESLPAFRFDPEIGDPAAKERASRKPEWLHVVTVSAKDSASPDRADLPAVAEDRADTPSYLSIAELGRRLRTRQLTSVQLTQHCLDRLTRLDPVLNCVVTLTQDLAMRQAEQADRELAEGKDRGPLHGIPWGAKDLIGVAGYATTWGAPQFRDQQIQKTATVARRLENAGAVLVAKLSLGALAMGDQWFNGQTKNPWNVEQGSSGSSAGSASAVAAGLVPFAIGSETLGSIVSPSRRCGVVGLRPTFGRVSRSGCMALSWTMDKIGPLARSADDCGHVLSAIHGRDDGDPTTVDRWFQWPMRVDFTKLRIGRVSNCETAAPEKAALEYLEQLGATLIDVELPREIPEWTLASMLDVEAACVFQELTRSGNLDGLNAWRDIFRSSHFVSAIDYLQASRIRLKLMQQMAGVFKKVDLYVGGNDLGITNLTGHPSMTLPVMMAEIEPQTRPLCCTLTAGLYDESTLLAVAAAIEAKADVLKFRPTL
jgi:Asp-tRNA(Asn)/Glu-tRNA(Gln) amidotransferase A subunit family amidase